MEKARERTIQNEPSPNLPLKMSLPTKIEMIAETRPDYVTALRTDRWTIGNDLMTQSSIDGWMDKVK